MALPNPSSRAPRTKRDYVLKALEIQQAQQSPLDDVLDSVFQQASTHGALLKPEDRAWITDVASGVTRYLSRLEWIVLQYADKRAPKGHVRLGLLMAAYQVLFHDRTPTSMIVSETVEWLKSVEGPVVGGFVNAILRRLSEQKELWKLWDGRELKQDRDLAAFHCWTPEWMGILKKDLGAENFKRFTDSSLERPLVHFRVKPGVKDFSPEKTRNENQNWGEATNYFVQDLSSQQLVQDLAAELSHYFAERTKRQIKVLDLCAAPGGKAIGLAWEGFAVTATDQNPKRKVRLSANVQRLAPGLVDIIDFEKIAGQDYDCIWIDAPCSGLGVVRRHPEIKWIRKFKDLEELNRIQTALLDLGGKTLRRGAFLMYSVCSVLSREGKTLVDKFLQTHPELGLKVVRTWELWPQDPPFGDGFFAILLRKD